jgi:very-short-patch-repair endonuclease
MPVKNIVSGQQITKEKFQKAKELRRDMTSAEKVLWNELRGNKLGVHFRRQQIIAGFIVDFYCHRAGLVIELDGSVHRIKVKKMPIAVRCLMKWACASSVFGMEK